MKNEFYWNDIPVGVENAVDYPTLCVMWGKNERAVRAILHELSYYDNGDNYVLIRSANGKGFYKTDDVDVITAYKKECWNKGRSTFAPLRKINRVLKSNSAELQSSIFNNLKVVRLEKGLSQPAVVNALREYDAAVDVPMLSRMENGAILPTPYQLAKLAEIYGVQPCELVAIQESALDIFIDYSGLQDAKNGV
jgi:hypothetical protein